MNSLAQLRKYMQPGSVWTRVNHQFPDQVGGEVVTEKGVPVKVRVHRVDKDGIALELLDRPGTISFLSWPNPAYMWMTTEPDKITIENKWGPILTYSRDTTKQEALELVNRLLGEATGFEDEPGEGDDIYHGEVWREPEDLEDFVHKDTEDAAKILPDVPAPKNYRREPDPEVERMMAAHRAYFQSYQNSFRAYKQAAPKFDWYAYNPMEERPPARAEEVAGEAYLTKGKLSGGAHDGEVINPALLVKMCVSFGIRVSSVIPQNTASGTMRARFHGHIAGQALAEALMEKYKDYWMEEADHDYKFELFASDDSYLLVVRLPFGDPQGPQHALRAQRIIDRMMSKPLFAQWPGRLWR